MSELLAADLHRILHEAALFASDDESLPPICGVQLTSTGKHLTAVGTTRFILGASSTEYVGHEFTVFIPLHSVRLILKMLKPGRRVTFGNVTLNPTPKRTRLWVAVADRHKGVTKLAVPTKDGLNFPKWKKLIPVKDEGAKAEDSRVMAFNPEYLAVFGKLSSHYRQARYLFTGPSKAAAVLIGDNFVGIIMPCRSDQPWELPGWAK